MVKIRINKMKYGLNTAVLAGVMAVSAFAHGGAEHVIGITRAVTADSVTVENAKHEMVTVLLRPTTEVKKSGVMVKIGALKVGDRVVIHAEENKAGKLEAEEVEFGPVAPK
jgi:hypothetical protein